MKAACDCNYIDLSRNLKKSHCFATRLLSKVCVSLESRGNNTQVIVAIRRFSQVSMELKSQTD